MFKLFALSALFTLGLGAGVLARADGGPPAGHPHGPPPEMTQACAGKADGDACTFTHHDQQEQGVCRTGRAGTMVCLP